MVAVAQQGSSLARSTKQCRFGITGITKRGGGCLRELQGLPRVGLCTVRALRTSHPPQDEMSEDETEVCHLLSIFVRSVALQFRSKNVPIQASPFASEQCVSLQVSCARIAETSSKTAGHLSGLNWAAVWISECVSEFVFHGLAH